MLSWEQRRLLWGKWQRLTRWEYWPIAAVYPPIVLYSIYLAWRHREWNLWANCNPALPASGMALESKGGILDHFQGEDGRVRLARYVRFPVGATVDDLAAEGFDYPLVLKPDLGQRGTGVAIISDEIEAASYLADCPEEVVVQEFIGGLEFGVHWSRHPDEKCGQILSLCQKHPQAIRGDGRRTLRELILADDRAVTMARHYFQTFSDDLGRVLEDGEEFEVAPIGTHARGAVFTDARELVTEALVDAFDELGARFPGFHFGRYDVKVPSIEDLQAGRQIHVLELNPVMGEPAHVYQPGYPWRQGMADFFAHFSRATDIGKAHQERGIEPPTMHEIISLAIAHHRKEYFDL